MSATITLATVQTDLAAWRAALTAASSGASFSLNGRTLTRQNVSEIKRMVAELSRQERDFLDASRTGKAASRLGGSLGRFS